ncbi:MAG: TetR/AcrR family transcriptional regulator [Lachnospiraceae bacterium]|nr:TetR/AcrR family transcriptional regulator [Lachnospiraceae bacterium]
MPAERKTDLRIQKTRAAIKDTFKEMIIEMDASQITVKELTKRAMIHRKTFYLHYTSIEALFEEILSELAKNYYKEIDQLPADAPFEDVNRVFFTFMAKQEPYMEKIVCSTSYREFADRFFLSMRTHNRARYNPYAAYTLEQQNVINTFLGVTSVNIYRQWIQDKKAIPLDDLIHLTGQLFTMGISSVR